MLFFIWILVTGFFFYTLVIIIPWYSTYVSIARIYCPSPRLYNIEPLYQWKLNNLIKIKQLLLWIFRRFTSIVWLETCHEVYVCFQAVYLLWYLSIYSSIYLFDCYYYFSPLKLNVVYCNSQYHCIKEDAWIWW